MGTVAIGIRGIGRRCQLFQALLVLGAVDAPLGGRRVVPAFGPAVTRRCAPNGHEVHHGAHARFAVTAEKVLVPVVDAGVQDGDAHAFAVQQAAARQCRQGRASTSAVLQQAGLARRGTVGRNADDVGARGQRAQRGDRHHGGHCTHRDVVVEHRPAAGQDVLAQRSQRGVCAGGVDQHLDMRLAAQVLGPGDRRTRLAAGYRRHMVAQVGSDLRTAGGLRHRDVAPDGQRHRRQHRQDQARDERPSCTHGDTPCCEQA